MQQEHPEIEPALTFLALHVILFVSPWVTVHGHPLLQIDLPARRVFLAGAIFTPSDTIFLALLLFFLAFSLFFFTAIFGRIWCGYEGRPRESLVM